jgi:hypothetical protein
MSNNLIIGGGIILAALLLYWWWTHQKMLRNYQSLQKKNRDLLYNSIIPQMDSHSDRIIVVRVIQMKRGWFNIARYEELDELDQGIAEGLQTFSDLGMLGEMQHLLFYDNQTIVIYEESRGVSEQVDNTATVYTHLKNRLRLFGYDMHEVKIFTNPNEVHKFFGLDQKESQ